MKAYTITDKQGNNLATEYAKGWLHAIFIYACKLEAKPAGFPADHFNATEDAHASLAILN